jgi:hypothetical protein
VCWARRQGCSSARTVVGQFWAVLGAVTATLAAAVKAAIRAVTARTTADPE